MTQGASSVSATVTVARPEDLERWDRYLGRHSQASVFLTSAWKRVVEDTYGHQAFYLLVEDRAAIRGVLPLFLIKSPLFGRVLATGPFGSWGAICADSQDDAMMLVEKAIELGRALAADHVELKSLQPTGHPSLRAYARYVNYDLPLSNAADVWSRRLRGRGRTGVRKAEKWGLTCVRGHDLLDEFYELMAISMRRLGAPVHAKAFYRNILQVFGPAANLLVVRDRELAVACLLLIRHGSRMYHLAGGSRASHWQMQPNNLGMWEAIKSACEEGMQAFDFGRSLEGSGTAAFKEQWGSTPVTLHYEYYLNRSKSVPEVNPANPRFRMAVAAWRRLPLSLTKAIGPLLIKGVP